MVKNINGDIYSDIITRSNDNAMPSSSRGGFVPEFIVIMFYIANEGISFVENVSEFLPLPQKMKDIFIQIREKDVNK